MPENFKQSSVKFDSQLIPQPETLEVSSKKAKFTVGVPKEISFQENRISLVPAAVANLVGQGIEVKIESDAGKNAHFSNNAYADSGAIITSNADEIYQCDIIVKVAPPLLEEIDKLKERAILFSALNLPGQQQKYFKKLCEKKVSAISYEHIKDHSNSYPVIRSLSEIVGNASIYIAAEYLSGIEFGKAKSLGGFSGIPPAEVVIIGAGNVGEFATRAAIGMGASVKVFDNSIHKLRNIQNNIHQRIYTSTIQPQILKECLPKADVVICALHTFNGLSPLVITEDMVKTMEDGSIIIDVSIVTGGCCETSELTNHTNPVFKKYGVTHYCVPNIASKVPNTASYALSNFFGSVLIKISEEGGFENYIKTDHGFRKGIYIFNGTLTNKYISQRFNLAGQDIDLFMLPYH